MARELLASFRDDAERMDGIYCAVLEMLANARALAGDTDEARALMDERGRMIRAWYSAAESGALKGPQGLFHVFTAYDNHDAAGWDRRVFTNWEPA
jgi:hypothetical protein